MKKIYFYISQYLLFVLRLFITWINGGQQCAICGSKTYLIPVCKQCQRKYFSIEKALVSQRCSICGRELISTRCKCTKCREKPVIFNVDFMFPIFSYRLWHKELLFRWKILGDRSLSKFYAKIICNILEYYNVTNIVPVPPRKGKIKQNGWDQIDEVCQFLKYKYNFTIINLLERISTIQQKKLNREERLETIKNAYSLLDYKGCLPDEVCLIDDVCTTGATIESCASLLKKAGIKKVYVVTLYIVD